MAGGVSATFSGGLFTGRIPDCRLYPGMGQGPQQRKRLSFSSLSHLLVIRPNVAALPTVGLAVSSSINWLTRTVLRDPVVNEVLDFTFNSTPNDWQLTDHTVVDG